MNLVLFNQSASMAGLDGQYPRLSECWENLYEAMLHCLKANQYWRRQKMKKSSDACKQHEDYGKQLTLLPTAELCPIWPSENSRENIALSLLFEGPLNQLQWLKLGHGWRLAAVIKNLDYMGWRPLSKLISIGNQRKIASYELPEEFRKISRPPSHGGCHGVS